MEETMEILEHGSEVLIGNYARLPIVMVRGAGSHLWDSTGKQYIDLFAGFGAGILGHCHPALIAAATEQAGKFWHVGNTFYSTPQIELADRLTKTAFKGRAFFCHSGLEANESAVKLARINGQAASPKKWKVVSMHRSFHGRSLAMISATGNPAVKLGFDPMVPGFAQVEVGDMAALTAAMDDETAAVMIEPIQGEGGINPISVQFATELRMMCTERKIALIFDEVWTGCGRTGKWFAYQHFIDVDLRPIEPDILTIGKAIGGGLPVGVMWAKPEWAKAFVPGRHGCTLGANGICMAVARAVFDTIEQEKLTDRAGVLGEYGMARLKNEKRIAGKISVVRGKGLMLGIELKQPPEKLVEAALERGVVVSVTAKNVVRIAPALNISRHDWEMGLDRLVDTIAAL